MIDTTRKSVLEAILTGKEKRAVRQKQLVKSYEGTLISFTLNIPGPCKDSVSFNKIHEIGRKTIKEALENNNILIKNQELQEGAAGRTVFFNIDSDALLIKKLTVDIEEKHPLGRLFDIDVLDKEGNCISRIILNLEERRCLICQDTPAIICRRYQKHSLEELLGKIDEMIEEFVRVIKI